jgi:hypothetical protein
MQANIETTTVKKKRKESMNTEQRWQADKASKTTKQG